MHVNRARVRPAELIVWGNVNLTAILSPSNEFDEEDDLDISEVTPIQQKDSKDNSKHPVAACYLYSATEIPNFMINTKN